MLKEIPNGLESLHFDTLTLSPIKVNWVKRWSKVQVIPFIGPMKWVLSTKDGKTQLGVHVMVFKRAR
jgi:hypothetical protein